jgi:hypothetical protein
LIRRRAARWPPDGSKALYAAELHHDRAKRFEALQNEDPPRRGPTWRRRRPPPCSANLERRFANAEDKKTAAAGQAEEAAADLGAVSFEALRGLAAKFVPDASLRTAADVKLFAALLRQVAETAVWLARAQSAIAQRVRAGVLAPR